ncbi:MAG: hypothetical protein LBE56_15010 [Tannerella sp.]|nr:hypothetical protein [Tannerella sp.]
MKLLYRRVYSELHNEVFYSLDELNRTVAAKMLAHNRKRIQRLPDPREMRFLAVEKPALRPIPATELKILSQTELNVGLNVE